MGRSLRVDFDAQATIVAPATAPGAAAIAIVRLSGTRAHAIAEAVFQTRRTTPAEPGLLIRGTFIAEGNVPIDDALRVLWRAPHSYTGEDIAEFHLHGSPAIVDAALGACLARGARLAEPGEFTRRAYLNGRMDLAQAEAVADLTRARTEAARRSALAQLAGALDAELEAARSALVHVVAQLEASVDYPEEGLEVPLRQALGERLAQAQRVVARLLASSARGRLQQQGARVVLAGAPNAGKSSLFNVLLGRERAIVSPHPGTTRDTIEATLEIDGVPITLVDTAGLREATDEIESVGIGRAREAIAGADLVLYLEDATSGLAASAADYAEVARVPHLVVATKSDGATPEAADAVLRRTRGNGCRGSLAISARSGAGLPALERLMLAALGAESGGEGFVLASSRIAEHLGRASTAMARAQEGLASALSPEFVVIDCTQALDALDAIRPKPGAQSLDEEVLDAVFSQFCLGK